MCSTKRSISLPKTRPTDLSRKSERQRPRTPSRAHPKMLADHCARWTWRDQQPISSDGNNKTRQAVHHAANPQKNAAKSVCPLRDPKKTKTVASVIMHKDLTPSTASSTKDLQYGDAQMVSSFCHWHALHRRCNRVLVLTTKHCSQALSRSSATSRRSRMGGVDNKSGPLPPRSQSWIRTVTAQVVQLFMPPLQTER